MKEIPLTQGKVALVDDADFDWLNQWKWHAWKHRQTWYARRNKNADDLGQKSATILMHKILCAGKKIDHWNRDGLDNQRSNLREATARQNAQNSSPKFGQGLRRRNSGNWQVRIRENGKLISLGSFASFVEAAWTYIEENLKRFRDFSPYYRNFCN